MDADIKPPNATQRILAHVLENPMKSAREIAQALDLAPTFAAEALHRLARQKKLVRELHGDSQVYYWRGMTGDDDDTIPVIRRAVTTWKPHHYRDPLVAAIHGPAGI